MDTFKTFILWLAIAAAAAPVWGALLYVLWRNVICPRLIPAADIERLAADLRERRGGRFRRRIPGLAAFRRRHAGQMAARAAADRTRRLARGVRLSNAGAAARRGAGNATLSGFP